MHNIPSNIKDHDSMKTKTLLLSLFLFLDLSLSFGQGQFFEFKEKIASKGRPLNNYKNIAGFEVDSEGYQYITVENEQWLLLDSSQRFIRESETLLTSKKDHYGNGYNLGNYYCG